MRPAFLALALVLQDPAPVKTDAMLQRARELAAARMLPIIQTCEAQQLYGEGKGLCTGLLMILPDHKEVRSIMQRNPWDIEIPGDHYKGKVKELAEFRARCRAAFYEILQAYQACAVTASKGTMDKRADPILFEVDMLVLCTNLLDPLGPGKPAKIKGLFGKFSGHTSRNGVAIVTDLPDSEQPDVVLAADDAMDAYIQFLEGHVKGIRQQRLPRMSIHYFQEQKTLDEFCKLKEIANPGGPAFTIGPDSYFRLDKFTYGIRALVLHQAPALYDPILLPATTRETAWITEGFACYLQSAQRYGLRIQLGRTTNHWEFKSRSSFIDLDRFCDMNAEQWAAEVKLRGIGAVTGQASALFRYLLQTREGTLRERFIGEVVVGGHSGSAAISEILGLKNLKEMEADFKRFANTLYRQKLGDKDEEPKASVEPVPNDDWYQD